MTFEGASKIQDRIPEQFASHAIFEELKLAHDAYEALSSLVAFYVKPGSGMLLNLSSFFFDSLAGTLESIHEVLRLGRVADAYTLLRRFEETSWLHIYALILLERIRAELEAQISMMSSDEDGPIPRMRSKEIEGWVKGKKRPAPRVVHSRIYDSEFGKQLDPLFDREFYRQQVSERCNDHVHINFFQNLRINERHVAWSSEVAWLNQLADDFRDLFIRHWGYLFTIHPHYMASSDYVAFMECGMEPPEGSEYWVAPVIQQAFDQIISPRRPDVTEYVRVNSGMELRP